MKRASRGERKGNGRKRAAIESTGDNAYIILEPWNDSFR